MCGVGLPSWLATMVFLAEVPRRLQNWQTTDRESGQSGVVPATSGHTTNKHTVGGGYLPACCPDAEWQP
jgi:hypothetical protein